LAPPEVDNLYPAKPMQHIDRRTFLTAAIAVSLGMVRSQAASAPAQRVWTFDNLQQIGGRSVTVEGQPKLVASPWGPAVAFDGQDDALFIKEHPLAGAATFTFEALFRPDGGAFEQRWFHLESDVDPPAPPGKGTTRMLFEIRVVENEWYLDTFMIGPGYKHPLIVPEKRFPIGRWYHVAQTYDGEKYSSYVNGELQAQVSMPFTPQGAGQASVGARMNRVSYFNGAVREARFTHEALRPSQFTRP
jgi:hypothetical protein